MKKFREESDSLGKIKVPSEKYWGAQTQRSLENFRIGSDTMPIELIHAFALQKKAAAISNLAIEKLDENIAAKIIEVCDQIIDGKLDGHFPLSVWQTGSGTQTNMNLNEVFISVFTAYIFVYLYGLASLSVFFSTLRAIAEHQVNNKTDSKESKGVLRNLRCNIFTKLIFGLLKKVYPD